MCFYLIYYHSLPSNYPIPFLALTPSYFLTTSASYDFSVSLSFLTTGPFSTACACKGIEPFIEAGLEF